MSDIWLNVLPPAALGLSACLLLLAAAFVRSGRALASAALLLALVGGGGTVAYLATVDRSALPTLRSLVAADDLALYFHGLFVAVTALVILLSPDYFERKSQHRPEFYGFLLLAATGMAVLASATHLITFYLGLETMSISFYVLAGFLRNHEQSLEASLKYFLLGAFSSAFLLFGIAFLYGSTGRLDFVEIATRLEHGFFYFGEPLLLLGFFFFLAGLFFKLSLIPFHFWAPDVYQGAPTPVTVFMAVGGKAAAAAAALRLFLTVFSRSPLLSAKWFTLLISAGLVTVFIGSMVALTQRHMKRLLAYSSIVHAGFIALGLGALAVVPAPLSQRMVEALLFYIAAYLFMNVGVFAVASLAEEPGRTDGAIRSYSGMGQTSPFLGALFSLFLFSLAGIPLTAGFLGKFYIFGTLVDGHFYKLAAWGLIGAVLATYYYLKVVVALYFPPAGSEIAAPLKAPPATMAALLIAASATLCLGILPDFFTRLLAGLAIG